MSIPDAVDDSSAGIAMCHIAVAVNERRESGYGTKQSKQLTADYVRSTLKSRRISHRIGGPVPLLAMRRTIAIYPTRGVNHG